METFPFVSVAIWERTLKAWAELEPEEVYTLLDHMNLSALAGYQPEPTE